MHILRCNRCGKDIAPLGAHVVMPMAGAMDLHFHIDPCWSELDRENKAYAAKQKAASLKKT